MDNTESTQLLLEILDQAKAEQAIEFTYIKNWYEFRYYSKLSKATRVVVKVLQTSANNLFKEYCRDVIAGISDVNKLLAYTYLCDVIDFYKNDINTLHNMLAEYDQYLGEGNFLFSFFGGERDLWNTH